MQIRYFVCCQCQRGIAVKCAAPMPATLPQHPAAGVCIDVKNPDWKGEFDPAIHTVCEGSGELPQIVC